MEASTKTKILYGAGAIGAGVAGYFILRAVLHRVAPAESQAATAARLSPTKPDGAAKPPGTVAVNRVAGRPVRTSLRALSAARRASQVAANGGPPTTQSVNNPNNVAATQTANRTDIVTDPVAAARINGASEVIYVDTSSSGQS